MPGTVPDTNYFPPGLQSLTGFHKPAVCLMRGMTWVFTCTSRLFFLLARAMAQVMNRPPLTAEALVRFLVVHVRLVVDKVALENAFLQALRFSLPVWSHHQFVLVFIYMLLVSWYSFLEAESTPGHLVPSVAREKKSPATPLGIDPETLRLVVQCLNHYATPGPG